MATIPLIVPLAAGDKMHPEKIEQFIESGYLKIENAFSPEIAAECRSLLWKATGVDPDNPLTWTQPVIRIGEMGQEPFRAAANTNVLHRAFQQLAGDNWYPRTTLGTFPIRFPSTVPAGDTGWHVDASFSDDNAENYFEWRINVRSKGRALLMLFLFSDVSEDDAPTLLRAGSHRDVASLLQNEGDTGLTFIELAQQLDQLPTRNEIAATGTAGTVYLCHPFVVHAAQDHRGKNPKFMAQPPLLSKTEFNIKLPYEQCCPIEKAILRGIKD
jgi:hypothetical protein